MGGPAFFFSMALGDVIIYLHDRERVGKKSSVSIVNETPYSLHTSMLKRFPNVTLYHAAATSCRKG